MKSIFYSFTTVLVSIILSACGGSPGGGSDNTTTTVISTSDNVIPVTVSAGPLGNYLNGLFGSITLCNTSNTCVTVNNVIFDTGSVGVRVLKSALPNNFLAPLPTTDGGTYSNCGVFADGYTWGDVGNAKIKLGNLTSISNIPVHIISQSSYSVPAACSSGNGTAITDLNSLGANAIVGIGLFQYDCGATCVNVASNNTYFSCKNNSCLSTAIPLAFQLRNPVAVMPAPFNNGTVISLPSISSSGSSNVSGNIYLGINTASNNTLNNPQIINTNNYGDISVYLNNTLFSQSFLDSGTSIYAITNVNNSYLPTCTNSLLSGFYCPSSAYNPVITLKNSGQTQSASTSISIINPTFILSTSNNAFSNIAETFSWTSSVDLGLTFFFGKNVATGIEATSSTIGSGTYFAF